MGEARERNASGLVFSISMSAVAPSPEDLVGRYAIYDEIATGGMATVHFGRLLGPVSFARTVAIKRLHPHLAREPEFVAMFLDEARVAARVRHPNVVPMLDIVTNQEGPPFLVMEYVQGESLARLLGSVRERGQRAPVAVACSIVVGMLLGLHAAHEAKGELGESLGIVHRDVSPQNVIVGLDGVPRLLDFGVAKAVGRLQTTREGQFKGKLAYTAPEVVRGAPVTRVADIYSAGVVLWEALTGNRLFVGQNDANLLERVLFAPIVAPSLRAKEVAPSLDTVVLRALSRDPRERFSTAREMARAVEGAVPIASRSEVGSWVEGLAGDVLAARAGTVARIERGPVEPQAADPGEGDALALSSASVPGAMASNIVPTDAGVGSRPPSRRTLLHAAATCALAALGWLAVNALRGPGPKSAGTVHVAAEPSGLAVAAPPAAAPSTEASTSETEQVPLAATIAPPPSSPPPHLAPAAKPASRDGASRHVAAKPTLGGELPAAAAKSPCDPPWTLDSQGIKQYKLQCL
jgi:serine/threonine-protein kinase